MFKINNRNTRKRCEICLKLTIKTAERPQWRRFGVFIVNFEPIFTSFFNISIVEFEQVNVGWISIQKSSYSVIITYHYLAFNLS